jgi:tetratricopeptide (TPR) repeat protein
LIYLLFSDERWQSFSDLRDILFQYLIGMATQLLGRAHPLTAIIRLCSDAEIFRGSSHVILKVILDISRKHLDKDTPEIGQLRRAQCDILRMHRAYDAAEVEAKVLVSENENQLGPNNDETIRALRRLAHIYVHQQKYYFAEAIYNEVLRRSRIERDDDFPSESCIFAYQNLAGIYSKRGDLALAAEYWRLAHDVAVYQFGIEHYESCYCKKKLDDVLSRQTVQKLSQRMPGWACTSASERSLEKSQACIGVEESIDQAVYTAVARRTSDLNFKTMVEFACSLCHLGD